MPESLKNPIPSDPVAAKLREEVLNYLRSQTTMTIASCRDSVPWAAPVFYASDGFDLYFLSNPDSRHAANLATTSRASAAIYGDCRDWRTIRGIQLEGNVELVRSVDLQTHFWTIYREKFPFVDELFEASLSSEPLKLKLSGIQPYCLTPTSLWYLDNSRGFGNRQELQLSPSSSPRNY